MGIELPILNHQLNFLVPCRESEGIARLAGIELVTEQVEGCKPGEDVNACDPQSMVVEPERSSWLCIRIAIHSSIAGYREEGTVPFAMQSIRREPGLWSAVKCGWHFSAMQVNNGGDSACERLCRSHLIFGICPMDGLIDGK